MIVLTRGDGNKDDRFGALSSSHCGLVELAAVLFYRVVTRITADSSWKQKLCTSSTVMITNC